MKKVFLFENEQKAQSEIKFPQSEYLKQLLTELKDKDLHTDDNTSKKKSQALKSYAPELILKIEQIQINTFKKMTKDDQVLILTDYAFLKKMVLIYSKKYFNNSINQDVMLERDNFEFLLAEAATKTINIYHANMHDKKKSKINIKKELKNNFVSISEILGYFTNTFKQNVKKHYVPLTTEKRKTKGTTISLHTSNSSDEEMNFEELLPSKETINSYENEKTFKLIDKTLKKHDSLNQTNLSQVFQELITDENHSDVAKKLELNNYGLKNKIKDISKLLEKESLKDILKESLLAAIDDKDSYSYIPDYKSNEKINNQNFVKKEDRYTFQHYININMKNNQRTVVCCIIDKYGIDKYKRVKEIKLEEVKIDLPENFEQSEINQVIEQNRISLINKYF